MQEDSDTVEAVTAPENQDKHATVSIRFRPCGKAYHFEARDLDLSPGQQVVVESEMGLSIGRVVMINHAQKKPDGQLKKVLRIATEKDFETVQNNRAFLDESKAFCVERVKELRLPMKIVTTETTLDKKRLVFYFTADGRIDFRELVRDLAGKFKTRIEMRQIGVRDEVKLLGGIGVCGRQTCCSLFLTSFEPVTIKMAKRQDLSINQSKLSGICGRLMCCLGYERRERSEGKEAAVQTEEFVTVTEESSEGTLLEVDSGSMPVEEPQRTPDEKAPVEQRRPAETREGEKIPGGQPAQPHADRDQQRKRHSRHWHRKHRKHAPDTRKPDQEKQPQESQAQGPAGEDKGKPFSKRRNFWKKKKH